MTGATLIADGVSWTPRRHTSPILHPVSFTLDTGRVLGVVGANGAGKSTLLRLLYRFNRPDSGTIYVDDDDIWQLSAKAVAKRVAAVLQEQPTDFALTVREIVELGRTPHRRGFASGGSHDTSIVEDALKRLELSGFSDRRFGTLSGGERQRVMVARALAQEPRLLILDEPTNHLDIRHQLEILDLIGGLDMTIVASLHDLNMAAEACDDVLLLHKGHAIGFGNPDSVLSEAAVSNAFSIQATREQLSPSGLDHLTFHLKQERL